MMPTENAATSEDILSMPMGETVGSRCAFIEGNTLVLRKLDVLVRRPARPVFALSSLAQAPCRLAMSRPHLPTLLCGSAADAR
jgi:hypothetical protein